MSKANKPHKLVLNLSGGLDLRSPNKHITLKNLSLKKINLLHMEKYQEGI